MKYNTERLIGLGKSLKREDFVFFWGHTARADKDARACLSQWWLCTFEVDGVYYNCTEQYMMAEKARLFGDVDTLQKVLVSYEPMEQKKLGRRVQGYDDATWKAHRFDAVLRGNVAKFSQNEKLRDYLLSTGDKILVEASPYDRIWGIGKSKDDFDIENPFKWKGENLLGFALMEVRENLK